MIEYSDNAVKDSDTGKSSLRPVFVEYSLRRKQNSWHELDVRVSSVLAGETQPKAALDDIFNAWEQITDRYGREGQKRLYRESYSAEGSMF
jgi:hypothetical protein